MRMLGRAEQHTFQRYSTPAARAQDLPRGRSRK